MKESASESLGPLIVCMGPSQLITGIEALKLNGFSLKGAQFIYVGTYNESLDTFFHEVSDYLDIGYVTPPLPVQISHPLEIARGNNFRSIRWLLNSENSLRDHSLGFRTDWSELQNRVTVISVRHTIQNDVVLLSILQPSQTILTADGVVLKFKPRYLNGIYWRPLDATLRKLPTDSNILCPSYLANNVAIYGTPVPMPTESLRQSFKSIETISLAENLRAWLLSRTKRPKSILILQQFAQAGLMSGFQEIDMIADLVEELEKRELTPVLIKPHPRDDLSKLRVLNKILAGKTESAGYLVPAKYAAVPVETLGMCLGSELKASVGWTSSALLSLKALTGCSLILVKSTLGALAFTEQCEEFRLVAQEYESLNLGGTY